HHRAPRSETCVRGVNDFGARPPGSVSQDEGWAVPRTRTRTVRLIGRQARMRWPHRLFPGTFTDSHLEPSHRPSPAGARPLAPGQVVARVLEAVAGPGVAGRGERLHVSVGPDRDRRAAVAEVPRLARGLAEKRPHLERDRVSRADAKGRRVTRVDR